MRWIVPVLLLVGCGDDAPCDRPLGEVCPTGDCSTFTYRALDPNCDGVPDRCGRRGEVTSGCTATWCGGMFFVHTPRGVSDVRLVFDTDGALVGAAHYSDAGGVCGASDNERWGKTTAPAGRCEPNDLRGSTLRPSVCQQ